MYTGKKKITVGKKKRKNKQQIISTLEIVSSVHKNISRKKLHVALLILAYNVIWKMF